MCEYQYDLLDLDNIDDEIAKAFDATEEASGWTDLFYSERHLRRLYAKKCSLLEPLADGSEHHDHTFKMKGM
ncbi:hypothetical protein D1823_13320 [Ruegeria sp. AD91A]|uniref:hypothetical protein n=1 Tax=Ruegeria sp. AD91A TaxID=2293862 RepID=UPI000E524577|nr:hypothetical protein [Ruegeria sp. AD91A]AXT27469.1 hypothetical protein D1823_13320 [Ruegeria sp. AD91A]